MTTSWRRLGLSVAGVACWLLVAGAIHAEPTSFPKAAKERYDQAEALMKQRRYKEAVQAYEEAIKLGMEDFPHAHLDRARSILGTEEYDAAIKSFTDFIAQFGLENSCRSCMRRAHGGRAAAYEKKGDWERAVQDHNIVVMLYAAEVEILNELATPDRASLIAEAAGAFRSRANALQKLDRTAAAEQDLKTAARLDLDAWKLSAGKAKPIEGTGGGKLAAWKPAPVGRLLLSNQWSGPVTLRIDGVDYRLRANEEKAVEKPVGQFEYELVESGQSAKGTVEPGRTFRVRVGN